MDPEEFVSGIERRLHPGKFSVVVRPEGNVLLTLLRRPVVHKVEFCMANALAVVRWSPTWDSAAMLGTARAEVRRAADANWLKPIMLYLVVCAPKDYGACPRFARHPIGLTSTLSGLPPFISLTWTLARTPIPRGSPGMGKSNF